MAALVTTGGVVTGAGLILAGTFATLTLLPLEELIQVGATVAVGVLLDTFVVRALLIPAIAYRLGERTWWPSRPAAGAAAAAASGGRRASVVRGAFRLLALGGVGAALLLERRAGGFDVVARRSICERLSVCLTSARSTFTSWAFGRHRVGGEHPAALGRELPGDVELVVALAVA